MTWKRLGLNSLIFVDGGGGQRNDYACFHDLWSATSFVLFLIWLFCFFRFSVLFSVFHMWVISQLSTCVRLSKPSMKSSTGEVISTRVGLLAHNAEKNFKFSCWGSAVNRVFSLTWPASMQIYWNKRKRLHMKRVLLPQDWFGTPTWPPFHCFGTPIWPPWRHVKTLYTI